MFSRTCVLSLVMMAPMFACATSNENNSWDTADPGDGAVMAMDVPVAHPDVRPTDATTTDTRLDAHVDATATDVHVTDTHTPSDVVVHPADVQMTRDVQTTSDTGGGVCGVNNTGMCTTNQDCAGCGVPGALSCCDTGSGCYFPSGATTCPPPSSGGSDGGISFGDGGGTFACIAQGQSCSTSADCSGSCGCCDGLTSVCLDAPIISILGCL